MLVQWTKTIPGVDLGLLEYMLNDENPSPTKEQFDAKYQHGGGWRPRPGFEMDEDYFLTSIKYPEDGTFAPLAFARLRDELIVFYLHAYVAIVQKDRSFEIARMD